MKVSIKFIKDFTFKDIFIIPIIFFYSMNFKQALIILIHEQSQVKYLDLVYF